MSGIAAVALAIGGSWWLAGSSFVPFSDDSGVWYGLDALPAAALLWRVALALAALVSVHTLLSRVLFKQAPAWHAHEVRYLFPLALVGVNGFSLLLLWPPARDWWAPAAFVAADLHPVVITVALGLSAYGLDLATGQRGWNRARSTWARLAPSLEPGDWRLLTEVGLVVAVLAVVLVSSPRIRFSPDTIGDEPKYIRYAENWWQGNGMDVTFVRDVSELPPESRARLGRNLRLLGLEVRREFRRLGADLKLLEDRDNWGRRFNKAVYAGNWIVKGKYGGFYLMHGPGISFIILPAYLLDRWWFDRGRMRFADDLFATNLVMLTIFAMVTVAVFRMLEAAGSTRPIALAVSAATALSLPLAAFAFPFYPETMAALIVCGVVQKIVRPSAMSIGAGAAIGLALGWLGWLHVRFLPLSVVALGWFLWTHRANRRAASATLVVYSLVIATLCFYTYHVTGSVIPSALYDAEGGHGGFTAHWVRSGLVGLVFDRQNGLLPLAPLYILGLAGIGIMLARPRILAMIVTLMLALFIPVAGHGYQADGTTPLRHVLAVIPLASIPVAALIAACRRRPWLLTVSASILALSVRHAVMYNLNNNKAITATVASTLSGWDTTLLFPLLSRAGQGGFDGRALLAWEILAVALIGCGVLLARSGNDGRAAARAVSPMLRVATVLVGLAALGTLAVSAGGVSREPRLLKRSELSVEESQTFRQRTDVWFSVGRRPPGPGEPRRQTKSGQADLRVF